MKAHRRRNKHCIHWISLYVSQDKRASSHNHTRMDYWNRFFSFFYFSQTNYHICDNLQMSSVISFAWLWRSLLTHSVLASVQLFDLFFCPSKTSTVHVRPSKLQISSYGQDSTDNDSNHCRFFHLANCSAAMSKLSLISLTVNPTRWQSHMHFSLSQANVMAYLLYLHTQHTTILDYLN